MASKECAGMHDTERAGNEREGGGAAEESEEEDKRDWKRCGEESVQLALPFFHFTFQQLKILLWLDYLIISNLKYVCEFVCVIERESERERSGCRCVALSVPVGWKWCVVFMLAGVMPWTIRILDHSSKTSHWRTHKHTLTLTDTHTHTGMHSHTRTVLPLASGRSGVIWASSLELLCLFRGRLSAPPHLCWSPAEPHFLLGDRVCVCLTERYSCWGVNSLQSSFQCFLLPVQIYSPF